MATSTTTSMAPPPLPPPPLPPPRNDEDDETLTGSASSRSMETLVSYPHLVPHEESLSKAPYDVTGWLAYLRSIDDVVDILAEELGLGGAPSAAGGGGGSKKRKHGRVVQAGGRTFSSSAAAELRSALRDLRAGRILAAERALSLLPGSYKLWRSHLAFRASLLLLPPSAIGGTGSGSRSSVPYAVSCSPARSRYRATVSAYERSLVRLNKMPRIWLEYAAFVVRHDVFSTNSVTTVRRLFDRALLALPATQHERIWTEYLAYVTQMASDSTNPLLKDGPLSTLLRTGAMESLPPVVIPAETALRVMRRHVCFDTTAREGLAEACLTYERWGEAASLFLDILNDHGFLSVKGTTRHELWMKLADVCTSHPEESRKAGVDFDAIVRAALDPVMDVGAAGGEKAGGSSSTGLQTFDHTGDGEEGGGGGAEQQGPEDDAAKAKRKDEQRRQLQIQLGEMEGTLWTKLADYHIRSGEFELARSVYEEALESVSRVRDFSLVFDAYMRFEEGVIEALMELMEDEEDDGDDEEGGTMTVKAKGQGGKGPEHDKEGKEDLDILLGDAGASADNGGTGGDAGASADAELALARAEHLTSRRPLLLNRVLLRQNPHNVGEWIQRSKLYLGLDRPADAAAALEEAVSTVRARNAVNGSPASVYIELARVHEEELSDIDAARSIYSRVCVDVEYAFKNADDLAQCYAAWSEFEVRHEAWDDALSVARRGVAGPDPNKSNRVARALIRSLRLWNLLLDLEESLGTVQTTKDAYDRALELRVATPAHVLNYASFLKEQRYFEESFTAYERGVDLFPFPHAGAKPLWKAYITSFVERYGGTKIPRVRELFDRCLDTCPPEQSSEFFLQYGEYEERHGLTKRALGVYERMCTTVPPDEKFTAYQLYITKTVQYLGVTHTRPLYERAIAALEDAPAAQMCLDFAKMETKLHELDRARTVLTYGAQLADPRRNPEYWKAWHEFEVSHGNEETFREMLRVKRGVQAAFSTVNYNAAEMGAGVPKVETLTDEAALDMIASREGVKVNEKPRIGGFVQGKRTAEMADLDEVERRAARLRKVTAGVSPGNGDGNGGGAADAGDEIDIDDVEEEEVKTGVQEDEASGSKGMESFVQDVSTKSIPAAVFGGLAPSAKGTEKGCEKISALDKLRAAAAGQQQ